MFHIRYGPLPGPSTYGGLLQHRLLSLLALFHHLTPPSHPILQLILGVSE